MFKSRYVCALAIAIALVASSSAMATMTYDFEDGTLQGWTNNPLGDGLYWWRDWDNGGVLMSKPSVGFSWSPYYANCVADNAEGDGWDGACGRVLISQQFHLDGTGNDITAQLLFGASGKSSITGTTFSSLPGQCTGGEFTGLALYDETTGLYVASVAGLGWDNNAGWKTFNLATTGLSTSDVYTLQLIHTNADSNGWISMDNVSISGNAVPEPSTIALLVSSVIGLLAYAWRKR